MIRNVITGGIRDADPLTHVNNATTLAKDGSDLLKSKDTSEGIQRTGNFLKSLVTATMGYVAPRTTATVQMMNDLRQARSTMRQQDALADQIGKNPDAESEALKLTPKLVNHFESALFNGLDAISPPLVPIGTSFKMQLENVRSGVPMERYTGVMAQNIHD